MSQNLGEASRALANQYIVEGVFSAAKSALVKIPFPCNITLEPKMELIGNFLYC